MLNDKEFNQWCDLLKLSEPAREIIDKVRTSEPVRRVKGTARNVHGPYASKKMGKTIQFESHTLELPALTSFYEYSGFQTHWGHRILIMVIIYALKSLSVPYLNENRCMMIMS